MRKFCILVVAFVLVSCAGRDREWIREGLLTLNLRQSAFLEEWGKPDRIYVTSGEEIMRAGWGRDGGGFFFKGKETFEVWVYEAKRTDLVFNRGKRLVAWKSGATVKELSSPAPSK